MQRRFLTLNGADDLVSIDLVAAHLYLLLPIGRELDLDDWDLQALEHALAEDIYTVVGRHLYGSKYSDTMRSKVKTMVMFVMNSSNRTGGWAKREFGRLFPEVYRIVVAAKSLMGCSGFAVALQQLEADLMVKLVGNELRMAAIPVLTVHDCIIVRRQDQSLAARILEQTGLWFTGFSPHFKIKGVSRG